jgi:hypothetical protein
MLEAGDDDALFQSRFGKRDRFRKSSLFQRRFDILASKSSSTSIQTGALIFA